MPIRSRRMLWSLRLDVFVAGAVVMGLELAGSRILAPSFGNSIFVWGSLIGVVLAALTLGYYWGGKLADRGGSFKEFFFIVFAAGFTIILVPLVTAPLAFDAASASGLGERYGPLLATTVMLALPTLLLGMVSPYAIKLSTASMSVLGGTAGGLYSLSTLGSIVGTFATVFIFIPLFGVREIILGMGVLLMAVSLIGITLTARLAFVGLLIFLLIPQNVVHAAVVPYAGTLVYSRETPYSSLAVVDDPLRGVRTLYLNGMPHSAMYLNGSDKGVFLYPEFFHLAFAFNPSIEKVLFVGGGGFTGPKKFLQHYPNVQVDVVEIDSVVIDVARKYFSVTDDPRLRVFNEDGRVFLRHSVDKYDLVVLDAYSKTYVPFHLMTVEFFDTLEKSLTERGAVVSNIIASLTGDASDILRAEYLTISQVFPSIHLFPTRPSSPGWVQNIILLATKQPENKTSIFNTSAFEVVKIPEFKEYLSHFYTGTVHVEDVPVLSDDYAPVETLLNPVTGRAYSPFEEEPGSHSPTTTPYVPLILGGVMAAVFICLHRRERRIWEQEL